MSTLINDEAHPHSRWHSAHSRFECPADNRSHLRVSGLERTSFEPRIARHEPAMRLEVPAVAVCA